MYYCIMCVCSRVICLCGVGRVCVWCGVQDGIQMMIWCVGGIRSVCVVVCVVGGAIHVHVCMGMMIVLYMMMVCF